MKTCITCETEKPLDQFNKKSGTKDGHRSTCRKCQSAYKRQWRTKNIEHARNESRKRYALDINGERDRQRLKNYVRRAKINDSDSRLVTTADMRRLLREPCRASHLSPCLGEPTIDHIIPISRGGAHSVGNLQMLCAHHNCSKKDRLWVEFVSAA